MLFAFDPTTGQILTALVGGGFLALSATIAGVFSLLNGRAARQAVEGHVADETGVIERYEQTMKRMDGKLDDILKWQGRHEAYHSRHDT